MHETDRHSVAGLIDQANALAAAGELRDAIALYRTVIERVPFHAGALNNLANLLRADGDPQAAIVCYRRALVRQASPWGTLTNLAHTLLEIHRPHDAIVALRRAVALRDTYAEAWNALGGAHLALDDPEQADTYFARALTHDPTLVAARFGHALALLAQGKLREGWAEYECRWDASGLFADTPLMTLPQWRGEPVAGRRVLVHAEQGLGDTIQFARYLPLIAVRDATTILMAPPSLTDLLAPLAAVVCQPGVEPPEHDLHCPLLSLPHVFATDLASIPATIPYLRPSAEASAHWATRLGPHVRPRIGLAFSGSAAHADDALRSIAAARILASLGEIAADLHVVQTDIRDADAAALAALPFVSVHTADIADFADTAALVSQMDLVVSVDTAIAHLAGAVGVPVWILLQYAADFRWMRHRHDSPWYPTAKLFRQSRLGDWGDPLERVAAEAAARFGATC